MSGIATGTAPAVETAGATPQAIDWARMAEPQDDGYDIAVTAALMDAEPMPWHAADARCDRIPLGTHPRIAEGRVAVGFDGPPLMPLPRFEPVPGVPATLTEAVARIGCWPAMAAQWPRIVHRVEPYDDMTRPALGSCSHNQAARFGVIGLTTGCPLGVAQAIVHEASHHKLRALGVDNEAAVRIVRNDPEARFFSPVVGTLRPMTAVLHAHYAFLHVLTLDLKMFAAFGERRGPLATLIARNAPRLAATARTIADAMATDAAGEAFIGAMLTWTRRVLAEADALLAVPPGHRTG